MKPPGERDGGDYKTNLLRWTPRWVYGLFPHQCDPYRNQVAHLAPPLEKSVSESNFIHLFLTRTSRSLPG